MLKFITYQLICITVSVLFYFSCSNIQPQNPIGLAVWADNEPFIALALNQYDWDSGFLMNHATNRRYSLHLCDSVGIVQQTLFHEKKVDGYDSEVLSLYYMKSRNYIILKSQLYYNGGKQIEKLYQNGKSKLLCRWGRENVAFTDTHDIEIVPSRNADRYVKSIFIFPKDSSPSHLFVSFHDSESDSLIGKVHNYNYSSGYTMRWINDTTVNCIHHYNTYKSKQITPHSEPIDISDPLFYYPSTSSSIYRKDKGFIRWNRETQSMVFSDTVITDYDKWDVTRGME